MSMMTFMFHVRLAEAFNGGVGLVGYTHNMVLS